MSEASESLESLTEVEPSPVDDTPLENSEGYFPVPSEAEKSTPHRTTGVGLSGSHGPVYYRTDAQTLWPVTGAEWLTENTVMRIQRYSSYAFSVFATMHITNTAIIPLITQSVPAASKYLLLTRPYYQSFPLEPLLIGLPLMAHIGSGIALRVYRRQQAVKRAGAENREEKRKVPYPKVSAISALGYAFVPLVVGHELINRWTPLRVQGSSASIGLEYVSHAFHREPLISTLGFTALITVGAWHITWGWAKWLGLTPAQVTSASQPGEKQRIQKRRWYGVHAVSALVAGLWLAGGLGVVGRGGEAKGWVGREYDELYKQVPIIGRWL